jgi:hypothetical protein
MVGAASFPVIPVLVAGIHLSACFDIRGRVDTGDKPRYDNENALREGRSSLRTPDA